MLPENICTICIKELENIENFINKCKKNSIVFENILQLKEETENKEVISEYSEQEDDFVDDLSVSESDDQLDDIKSDKIVDNTIITEALKDIQLEQSDKQLAEKGKCKSCGEKLPLGGLRIHYQKSPECTPKCPICAKSFYPIGRLKSHILAHGKKPSYKCPACKSIFPSAKNLRKHVVQEHPDEKPFVCKVCKKGKSCV